MKTPLAPFLLASFTLCGPRAGAETPLARPLADFDQLVSQLKVENVVAAPIRVGNTAVIPFGTIKFGLGGGKAGAAFGGGMTAKTVPIGILIVEGDDVRVELFPEQGQGGGLVQQVVQGILDHKVVVMGNGVNLGHASGNVDELAPLISGMIQQIAGATGQTTFMGNALNFGSLEPRQSGTPTAEVPRKTEPKAKTQTEK